MSRNEVLITASELAERLHAVTILDVRWQLTEPDGRAAYEKGHIPGAVYVSLEDELSDHTVTGRGRHPLPSGLDLEAAARRWGVRQGVPVVVYDDWNRAGSARAWWVLTAAALLTFASLTAVWARGQPPAARSKQEASHPNPAMSPCRTRICTPGCVRH